MKTILKLISIMGLILTLVPSILVFSGSINIESHKLLMFIGAVFWFSTAPFWINKEKNKISDNKNRK